MARARGDVIKHKTENRNGVVRLRSTECKSDNSKIDIEYKECKDTQRVEDNGDIPTVLLSAYRKQVGPGLKVM